MAVAAPAIWGKGGDRTARRQILRRAPLRRQLGLPSHAKAVQRPHAQPAAAATTAAHPASR
jgi:hypothetical protein